MIIGVSIILQWKNLCLFEIQKSSKWERLPDDRFPIGVGCIGGWIEEDETAEQALMREVQEEIGCGVSLEKSTHPFRFGPSKTVEMIFEEDTPAGCLFLWEEQKPGYIEGAHVAVYLGAPIGQPSPGDLSGIIGLDFSQLFEMRDRNSTVQDMMDAFCLNA